MNLRDYLHFEEITYVEFAKKLDYSPAHIRGIAKRRLKPSKKLCRAIERATEGKVTCEELLNQEIKTKQERKVV